MYTIDDVLRFVLYIIVKYTIVTYYNVGYHLRLCIAIVYTK